MSKAEAKRREGADKSLGQVLYEAFAAGSFSFRKRDWASLAPQAQADFEREALAVAAVVLEQAAERVLDLTSEEGESRTPFLRRLAQAIRSTK